MADRVSLVIRLRFPDRRTLALGRKPTQLNGCDDPTLATKAGCEQATHAETDRSEPVRGAAQRTTVPPSGPGVKVTEPPRSVALNVMLRRPLPTGPDAIIPRPLSVTVKENSWRVLKRTT